MERDYSKDLEIDFYNLHVNWQEQAGAYMYWAEQWANAQQRKDKRKEFLSQDIRENPTFYGLPPGKIPSEAAITNLIDVDPEYIDLSHEVNTLKSTKTAFEHRRAALDGLTSLFTTGYFSSKDIPLELKEVLDEARSKQVQAAQKDAINEPGTKRKLKRRK